MCVQLQKGQVEEIYSIDEQIALLTSYCSIHKSMILV